MGAEDVLIKLSFTLNNANAADKAANKLQKVGAFQDLAISKTSSYENGIKKSHWVVDGFGMMSQNRWNGISRATVNAVDSIHKYKSSTDGTFRVVNAGARRNVTAWGRIRHAMRDTTVVGEKLRKISWSFTMLSMGMLGVFFSMMSFMMLLRKGFDMIASPLMDIESAATMAAEAFAFNNMIGNDLTDTYGSLGDIIGDQVGAWIGLSAVTGQLKLGLLLLGAAVFNDKDFILELSDAIGVFIDKLNTPEMIAAIQSIIVEFANMLPVLADMLPYLASFLELMAPIIPYMVMASVAAAMLMPILSNLSALFGIAGHAAELFGTLAESRLGIALAARLAPALGAVSTAVQGVVAGIAAFLGISVGWLVVIVAVIAAIGIIAYKLGWLDGIIRRVKDGMAALKDVFVGAGEALSSFNIMGTASAMPTAGGMYNASPNNTTIHVDQTVNVERMDSSEADNVMEEMSNDYHRRFGRF